MLPCEFGRGVKDEAQGQVRRAKPVGLERFVHFGGGEGQPSADAKERRSGTGEEHRVGDVLSLGKGGVGRALDLAHGNAQHVENEHPRNEPFRVPKGPGQEHAREHRQGGRGLQPVVSSSEFSHHHQQPRQHKVNAVASEGVQRFAPDEVTHDVGEQVSARCEDEGGVDDPRSSDL